MKTDPKDTSAGLATSSQRTCHQRNRIMNSRPNQTEQPLPEIQSQTWEQQVADVMPPVPLRPWKEPGYDAGRFALIGLLLGGVAGCTSLILNIIGSVLWPAISGEPQHPLRLIQVYLTFPLGESALELNSGSVLALGSLLYLCTGMLYGMFFELVISYFLPFAGTWVRILVCSVLSIVVWAVNYYAILLWLQPTLFGGSWIVELIPAWVAVLTHLVFGWTMALLFPLGEKQLEKLHKL
jgi:hypothetical protein